jgi:signal transduction histidine kinase
MDPHLRETIATGALVKKVKLYQGKDHLFLSAPLYQGDELRGALQAVLSLNDVEESMATFQHTLLVFTVTTAIAFIVIGSVLLSRYLVKPLEKLIKATEDISEGFVPQHLEPTGQNEIGTLSLSLARMTDKLKDDKQEIENYIHSLEESNTRLKRAQGDVIRSEKLSSVGRLAAGVAHEIGNPIGIILGYIEILRQNGTTHNENADALSRLENEVMRIDTIIRELLSFSRPTTVAPHPILINPIIQEATSFIVHQKEFRAIQVELDLTEHLPCVMADEGQVQQVLVNLFLNAMDAMPEGGRLSVGTSPGSPAHIPSRESFSSHTAVSITVSDTGTGIEEKDLNKIFDPFYTTKSPGKGTGLGLSVCLSIVETFGGTLSVASTPGRGTIFTIVLPTVPLTQPAQA